MGWSKWYKLEYWWPGCRVGVVQLMLKCSKGIRLSGIISRLFTVRDGFKSVRCSAFLCNLQRRGREDAGPGSAVSVLAAGEFWVRPAGKQSSCLQQCLRRRAGAASGWATGGGAAGDARVHKPRHRDGGLAAGFPGGVWL